MYGLEMLLKKTSSKPLKLNITAWEELQNHIKEYFPGKCFVVSYLDYKILIGKVTEKGIEFYREEVFDPKYLIKLRVFNEQKELLLWREKEYQFSGRFRIDDEGDEEYFVPAEQLLWGKVKENKDDWVLLSEARGTQIHLPYKFKKPENKLLMLRTHNYIGYNELGQAGYIDCRFVSFCKGGTEDGSS